MEECMLDTGSMSEEQKEKRRMIFELVGEEARMILELKVKLLREGRTLKHFVLEAIRDKLKHDKKK